MKDAKGHGSAAHQGGVNSLTGDVQQHQAKWEAQGVRNSVFDRPARSEMQLSDLVVPAGQRGHGIGSQYVRELADIADKHGRTITLSPATKDDHNGTTSSGRLKAFYKQFGFVENKGRNTDFTISDRMYRKPRLK